MKNQTPVAANFSLRALNTFGVDVKAKYFVDITNLGELEYLQSTDLLNLNATLVLGGGSNILFTENFDGLILKNSLRGIEVEGQDSEVLLLKIFSGELWHDVVMYAVQNNLGGIENLSLIPGSAGAAPIQNIGAYGVELESVFEKLTAIDLMSGERKTYFKSQCAFGYRDSVFKNEAKGKYFIESVTLRLAKHPVMHLSYGAIQKTLDAMDVQEISVKAVSDAVIYIRKQKLPDPSFLGNAGSFFKNPEIPADNYNIVKEKFPDLPGYLLQNGQIKIPAGWLIEQCGWKGKRVGNCGAHKDQALVLVNYGNATGSEILELAVRIQESVFNKFLIKIEPEVNIL